MHAEVATRLSDEELAKLTHVKNTWRADGSHDNLQPTISEPASYLRPNDFYSVHEKESAKPPKTLGEFVTHFDQNWYTEGLPQKWYTLDNKVGFSMNSQMKLLESSEPESVQKWASQTKRDLLGFCLEYLSDTLVYPYKYREEYLGNEKFLRDPKYGKDILETTSEKERNGSVAASLSEIKTFFMSEGEEGQRGNTDQSLAVMCSPAGPSGLATDDGKAIDYPDSYWFIMEKTGTEVRGVTVKTDFSSEECREALRILTGKELSPSASVEEYVRTLALIPGERKKTAFDVIEVLQQSRDAVRGESRYAFKKKPWSEVHRDIQRGESLYSFNDETQALIREFEAYVAENNLSHDAIQKALAATLLRLSKLFLFDEKITADPASYIDIVNLRFGRVLQAVSEIPGCAGGGRATVVESGGIMRLGMVRPNENNSSICMDCGSSKKDNHYHCPTPTCNKRYADETHLKIRTPKCTCGFEFGC